MLASWFRQYPVFSAMISLALLGIIALATTITTLATANHRARLKLKKTRNELRTFAAAGLLLSEAEAKIVEDRVAVLEKENGDWLARNTPETGQGKGLANSVTATDAFFELAGFVQRMAEKGRAAGVKLAQHERFGFASYENTGPEVELIPTINAQRATIERVLAHLFAARPEQLLIVARERPAHANTLPGRVAIESPADFFTPPPTKAARPEDEVSTSAVRIGFVGDTSVLRNFLIALVTNEPRLVIRCVEVDTLVGNSGERAHSQDHNLNESAVVSCRNRFWVVVEAFEFTRSPLASSAS